MLTENICDVCDLPIPVTEIVFLHLHGIAEKLRCHNPCADIVLRCRGDFSKLPDGRLKRSIQNSVRNFRLVSTTNITVRRKQARALSLSFRKSNLDGIKHIQSLAVDFYGLPKLESPEFYSIDNQMHLIVVRKVDVEPEPTIIIARS